MCNRGKRRFAAGPAWSPVLLFLAAAALADTYPRQDGVDALHYTFRLTLRDDAGEIAGETTAQFRFLRDGVKELRLDLADGMAVSAVLRDARAVTFTHTANRLVIALDPAPAAGERRAYTILYRGVPASGFRIGANKHGERTFFSSNWPDLAHQWLPVIDHPYDKATSEFIVTAPAKYQVIANGALLEETDRGDGTRLTHWSQTVPIPVWLNALGVAQFSRRDVGSVQGIPLQTWVYHQDRANGIATFDEPARRALDFYVSHIGPFPYQKLANVEAAGVSGGMEHASAIFYGETSVTAAPATSLVAHEIAHQWFGDSVTEKDWDDVWLSEGFATYFALLTTEHYSGRDAFVAGLERSRTTIRNIEKANPALAVIHNNLADMKQVLNGLVYQKGAWVLHMLRYQVGTANFWAGIREYYQRYRDSSATTADLRQVMEEQSGMQLGWFFDQWLKRPGSPMVESTWRYDDAAKAVIVELTQTQAGAPFRLPLEIAVDGKVEKVEMTAKQQRVELRRDKAPQTVVLDPGTWQLIR